MFKDWFDFSLNTFVDEAPVDTNLESLVTDEFVKLSIDKFVDWEVNGADINPNDV